LLNVRDFGALKLNIGGENVLSRWKRPEIVFAIWSLLALASLLPVTLLLNGSFPVFTVLWILVPLIAVGRTKDASQVGFRAIPWRELIQVTAINLGGLFVVMLFVEPWSHTYQMLLKAALSSQQPDTTFAWLLRFQRVPALGAMLLYSGLVTLFGEELFFRGWLLQLLQKRWGTAWAVVIQALLFMVPNLLATFVLPPLQGVLYALVYTWLAIGTIGGWAALRTQSIWPSLISATVSNFVFVALIV
jgi:membrane protease YdiL (CAAX protease family)